MGRGPFSASSLKAIDAFGKVRTPVWLTIFSDVATTRPSKMSKYERALVPSVSFNHYYGL
jgi:hypothetical protein